MKLFYPQKNYLNLNGKLHFPSFKFQGIPGHFPRLAEAEPDHGTTRLECSYETCRLSTMKISTDSTMKSWLHGIDEFCSLNLKICSNSSKNNFHLGDVLTCFYMLWDVLIFQYWTILDWTFCVWTSPTRLDDCLTLQHEFVLMLLRVFVCNFRVAFDYRSWGYIHSNLDHENDNSIYHHVPLFGSTNQAARLPRAQTTSVPPADSDLKISFAPVLHENLCLSQFQHTFRATPPKTLASQHRPATK